MSESGTFILSIDCEGLWGMADRAVDLRSQITEDSLKWAYRSLLQLLDELEIGATFAFTSLFTMPPEDIRVAVAELQDLATHRAWLEPALHVMESFGTSGWSLPQALDWVADAGEHELASHSFTHLPLAESPDPRTAARAEFEGVSRWARERGLQIETYVFPRNQVVSEWVGIPGTLRAYRDYSDRGGPYRRVASEFNIWQRAQFQTSVRPSGSPLTIPGGFICNHRTGPRRRIPIAVTRARWRSICRDAVRRGGVAHLWLHPHNLITGHRQLELLRLLLSDTQQYVQNGEMQVQTQSTYAKQKLRQAQTRPSWSTANRSSSST